MFPFERVSLSAYVSVPVCVYVCVEVTCKCVKVNCINGLHRTALSDYTSFAYASPAEAEDLTQRRALGSVAYFAARKANKLVVA